MNVELIAFTPNADDVCGVAARTCVSKDIPPSGSLYGDWSTSEYALRHAIQSGHESVAEHASFTFAVSGVSRALTHQLVRHRVASFSQQSQRYVNMDEFAYVVPKSIMENPDAFDDYIGLMSKIRYLYEEFASEDGYGIDIEDVRYILPNACTTNILVTMNARELRHFFALRCCTRAQWEIRELADKMLELVKPVAPTLFENAGASCVQLGYCPEGEKKCCGKALTLNQLW